MARKDRKPYGYDAFVPPLIADSELLLSGPAAAACERAALAVYDLNSGSLINDLETIATPLLRSESVASSRIENLRVSHRRVAEAIEDPRHAERAALEVSRNVIAMQAALDLGDQATPITANTIRAIHKALLDRTPDADLAGVVRRDQNWIGGSDYGPRNALYVPPPPKFVEELLDDLAVFANRKDVSPIGQAAIVHAQFEAIHPFLDGNGRTGRCLVHVVLRRRGVAPRVTSPVSAALMVNRDRYFASLASYQQRGEVNSWVGEFAGATERSVVGAKHLGAALIETKEGWRSAAGQPRSGSVAARLIEVLPSSPLLSAGSAARSLDVDANVARRGLNQLDTAGVLRIVSKGDRNRVWAADDLFDLLDEFEHTLTGGKGPTRHLRRRQ